jgi:threonine dehydratase
LDIVLGDDSTEVTTMFLLMEKAKLVIERAGATSFTYLLSKSHDTDIIKSILQIMIRRKMWSSYYLEKILI